MDHLKNLRSKSLEDKNYVSEPEILQDESAAGQWQSIQDIQRKMNAEIEASIIAIKAKYQTEIDSLKDEYALVLTLTR